MSLINPANALFSPVCRADRGFVAAALLLFLCSPVLADRAIAPAVPVVVPALAPDAGEVIVLASLRSPDPRAASGESAEKKGTAGILQYRLPENESRIVLPFLATGALLALTDRQALKAFDIDPLTEDSGKADPVFQGLNFIADGRTLGASLVLFYAIGNHDQRNTARTSLIALGNSALATAAIKGLVGKERPDQSDGHVRYHGPSLDYASFPSGHTAAVTSVACVLAHDYPRQRWLWWTLVGAVAVSRISSGQHFASDVFFGAGIGVVSAEGALHNRNEILSWRF